MEIDKKELQFLKKELQRAKQDLEDLEIYLEGFFSFLPLAVCTVNPGGIIIDINKAFQTLTGYKSIEIVGKAPEVIFSEKKEIVRLEKEITKKEVIRGLEATLITKEKKKIPVSLSVSIRKDEEGSFIGYFIALSDITEIKKSQEELEGKVRERTKELEDSRKALMNMLEDVGEARAKAEEEKNKTLTIITNLTDGLLVFDINNKILLINPQAEAFFNTKKEDMLGKSILELNGFSNLKPLVDLLKKEIRGIFRKELSIRENLIIEVSTVPMVSKEGETGTLVVLHDISREKTVERIKTEFVSLAAHQLRTPLSAIKWTLRMLLDGDFGEITKEQRDFIEKTYRSNERMIILINDLLDVTRIEEGRYVYRPALVNLEDLVQFVANSYKEEIDKRNLKLEFKTLKTKLPQVEVDVEKIRLVIQNFLDNAIRYTPPGGKITISLKYNKDKKEVEFLIKDTGAGIPREQQGRIFTKFFRGANVIRMATEGSGLGLFISKNIIEAHGGRAWFESKEGEGSTFYFTLPIGKEFEELIKEF